MLSAIIATRESERALVPTLAALVPGVVSGLLTNVLVADGGSRDATHEVADVAGCRFISSPAALGERLKQAAASTSAPWLLFLRAGTVPEPAWVTAAGRFIDDSRSNNRAAVFRARATTSAWPSFADAIALLRALAGGAPSANQGLLIARSHYDSLGGHHAQADAEADLLARIGRRHIAVLAAAAAAPK
jgi:hypothetical protein